MLYCSLDCAKECAEGNQMNEIKFADLGLDKEILRAIQKKGYESPTPVQAQAIPPILKRLDVMAAAQTGTGKTAGFTLPILHRLLNGPRPKANEARVLILTPTRELAAQVVDNVRDYGRYLNLSYAVAFGGVSINPQKMKLRRGVDILVATPGRLLDLYNQRAVKFPNLETFVLDEADRMLDMGFIHDIKKTIALLPKKRQNLMFSATFSLEIRKLAKGLIHNPVEISIGVANSAIEVIKQWHVNVEQKQKANLLIHLIKENNWQQVLVFMRTKHGANRLVKKLDSVGINALAIHGNKSQGARTKALADFKSGDVKILVATDIAARGIDINQLPLVINFDLPNVAEDYVHRIGRTARAGKEGDAISLVSSEETRELCNIERLIKQKIPLKVISDFKAKAETPVNRKVKKDEHRRKPKKKAHRKGASNNKGALKKKSAKKLNSWRKSK
jgi:ATP-dependent RNA helicase RhlE